MRDIQSVIMNISFPRSLDEILDILKSRGALDHEHLLTASQEESDYWTMPKWFKANDVVFFMHSKNSRITLSRLRNILKQSAESYDSTDYKLLSSALEREKGLYEKLGGKIFAVGHALERARYGDEYGPDYDSHWKSKIYAEIGDYWILQHPIDLSEFGTFIRLSCGGSLTPVFGKDFDSLKSLLQSRNTIPAYLADNIATPIPLAFINDDNWIQVASKYRHNFMYEIQLRRFYTDYLLRFLGDQKKIFRECSCKRPGEHISYADNVILIGGLYLTVEIKLNIQAESDLAGQVRKYCSLDSLVLDTKGRLAPLKKIFQAGALIIDMDGVYWYSDDSGLISQICSLDNISTKQDILALREKIISIMKS